MLTKSGGDSLAWPSPMPGAVAGTVRVRGARHVPDARVGPCPWRYGNQAKKALYTALASFTAGPVEVG